MPTCWVLIVQRAEKVTEVVPTAGIMLIPPETTSGSLPIAYE